MPLLSISVTTFNRKALLKRCLDHILSQTFQDYEVIVTDDASADGTFEMMTQEYRDSRIHYYRLTENIGASGGDRAHMRRFVDLAQGKYILFLTDDDYLLRDDLLECELALFETYPTAGIVMGGHLSVFMTEGERRHFHDGVFPSGFITSNELLDHFSSNPISANITAGARIYDKEKFIRSGILQPSSQIAWEAGFELLLGPACYGDFVYINEPSVWVEIWPHNASFQGTQLSHFLDSVASVKAGFRQPLLDFPERKLEEIQRRIIENIGKAYLGNAADIRCKGTISYASPEHCAELVTGKDVSDALADL